MKRKIIIAACLLAALASPAAASNGRFGVAPWSLGWCEPKNEFKNSNQSDFSRFWSPCWAWS